MAITAYSDKPHLGGFSAKKIVGEVANGNALNTQIDLPITNVDTVELENNSYPGQANASAGAVNTVRGKKANLITISAVAHPAWFIQKNINDWIGGAAGFLNTVNSVYDTSVWDLNVYEPVLGNRRYTSGKCQSIAIAYNAGGGAITVSMSWIAIYGGEQGSPNTFAAPTRVTGQDYNTADMTTTSTDLNRSWVITIARGQASQNVGDGTYYPIAITSHAIGGTFTLEESPTAVQGNQIGAAVNTLTGTGIYTIGASGTGVKFILYVNRDSRRRAFPGNQGGTEFFDYSLADVNNVLGTGYPFQIIAAP